MRPTWRALVRNWIHFAGAYKSDAKHDCSASLESSVLECFCFIWSESFEVKWVLPARERLKRMRSVLNIQMVQKYRDKLGRLKVKGGKHLRQSAQYPIGLGMQARSQL